jgi:hypothetical protein
MTDRLKVYTFEAPLYCLGRALGELSVLGAWIQRVEPLRPRPVPEETFLVEAKLDPSEYENFQKSLASMIALGPEQGPFCSFCGKSKSEVTHLVGSAHPHASICDECVYKCVHILKEQSDR